MFNNGQTVDFASWSEKVDVITQDESVRPNQVYCQFMIVIEANP